MEDFWDQFEGFTTGGYVLGARLDATAGSAYFEASGGDGKRIARLVAGEDAPAQVELWTRLASLSHPHLLRLFACGQVECDGGPVAYTLMERPDEILGDVLTDRALTREEAGHALAGAAEALACLHEAGFVHGELSPWSVVASGDSIKVPCDGARTSCATLTPAVDVRALGLTACEMLARHAPNLSGGDPRFTPEEAAALGPFERFARNCLRDGGNAWSAAQAAAWLRGPQQEPAPAPAAPALTVAPQPVEMAPAPARPAFTLPRWTYAAVATCALAGVLYVAAKARPEPPAPVPPARVRQARPPVRPPASVSPEPASAPGGHSWRVIVYTYNGLTAAEKKAHDINRKWPQFKAEVFAPRRGGPYLVSLAGGMTHEQALRLRHAARRKGLPRDTFVRRY